MHLGAAAPAAEPPREQAVPDEQREVLGLVTIEGLSYQEAADTLQVPIGTIMSRLARARRKLAGLSQSRARSRVFLSPRRDHR